VSSPCQLFCKFSASINCCSIVPMRNYVLLFLILCLFSCKRKWTDKDKSDFYSGCLNNAAKNADVKNPKSYCNCLLQKVVTKYPNANDAKYIRYDSTIRQFARECLKLQ
jgi:hypothetical protein